MNTAVRSTVYVVRQAIKEIFEYGRNVAMKIFLFLIRPIKRVSYLTDVYTHRLNTSQDIQDDRNLKGGNIIGKT